MRIMPDTNVMVSAALFPNSKAARALSKAMQEHTLVVHFFSGPGQNYSVPLFKISKYSE